MYYIYRYYVNDEIVYVGKTTRHPYTRFKEHKHDGVSSKDWKAICATVDRIEYAVCPNNITMDFYEIFYIAKDRPKYNHESADDSEFNIEVTPLNFVSFTKEQLMEDYRMNCLEQAIDPAVELKPKRRSKPRARICYINAYERPDLTRPHCYYFALVEHIGASREETIIRDDFDTVREALTYALDIGYGEKNINPGRIYSLKYDGETDSFAYEASATYDMTIDDLCKWERINTIKYRSDHPWSHDGRVCIVYKEECNDADDYYEDIGIAKLTCINDEVFWDIIENQLDSIETGIALAWRYGYKDNEIFLA